MKNVNLYQVLEVVCLALSALYLALALFKGEQIPMYAWAIYGIALSNRFKGEK